MNIVCQVFWEYFDNNFFEQTMSFSVFESVIVWTLQFLRGQGSRYCLIIGYTHRRSKLYSRKLYAGVERYPGRFSCLGITSVLVHNTLLCLQTSFIYFFSSNVTSLSNLFQQFFQTIYVPFIFWMSFEQFL